MSIAGQWFFAPSSRLRMMCPSRIPRTSSAIGSSMSPPATRMVYKAVIEPFAEFPVRSSKRGSMAKTEGGYPCRAGGSPTARPISRCARANRVVESIINRTLAPFSRKYSAMAVDTKADFKRTREGVSEVATTRTERAIPSSPRDSSMKSRTSRPRSPIRQMTLTSEEALRAICPMRVDLPTPEPAKSPTRCPSPTVRSPSIARTPKGR